MIFKIKLNWKLITRNMVNKNRLAEKRKSKHTRIIIIPLLIERKIQIKFKKRKIISTQPTSLFFTLLITFFPYNSNFLAHFLFSSFKHQQTRIYNIIFYNTYTTIKKKKVNQILFTLKCQNIMNIFYFPVCVFRNKH